MDIIKSIIEEQLNSSVLSVSPLGSGDTATAYIVETSLHKIVVKTGNHKQLLIEEKEMLDFLREKVNFKIPETYFLCEIDGKVFLGMEFIDGIAGASNKIKFLRNKKKLANNIIDCFEEMQNIHNDKFGFYHNAVYDTWQEFYRNFFDKTFDFAKGKYNENNIDKIVIDALNLTELNFDEIFKEVSKTPSLSHGDFWVNNMIIDQKNAVVAGVFDPHNVAWVEPEYEIFCFDVGQSTVLKLYKRYKRRNKISKYCDLKIQIYALVNELDWYKSLGHISNQYINMRAKKLIRNIKKNKLRTDI